MINSGTPSELEHFGNPKYEKLLKSPIINGGKRISSQNVQVSADYWDTHMISLYFRKILWPISIYLHNLWKNWARLKHIKNLLRDF